MVFRDPAMIPRIYKQSDWHLVFCVDHGRQRTSAKIITTSSVRNWRILILARTRRETTITEMLVRIHIRTTRPVPCGFEAVIVIFEIET
jgi:hypothetical protein